MPGAMQWSLDFTEKGLSRVSPCSRRARAPVVDVSDPLVPDHGVMERSAHWCLTCLRLRDYPDTAGVYDNGKTPLLRTAMKRQSVQSPTIFPEQNQGTTRRDSVSLLEGQDLAMVHSDAMG